MTRLHTFRFSLFCSLLVAFLSSNCFAQQPASRVVDLSAADGTKLKATYFGASKPGPGVLLLHQCNRQRKIWDGLAQQLASAGLNVLTLDLRGFGESGGTPIDKATPQEAQAEGNQWPSDIDIAFQYLQSQNGVNREAIGVGGASCGVNNAVQAARRHPKEVKSLVLLSGNTDFVGRQFLRQAANLPLLASVAEDDEFRPSIDSTKLLFVISTYPNKRFASYETGGHGADMFPTHPELRTMIVDWYVNTLMKTPGRAPASKETWTATPQVEMLNIIDQAGGPSQAAQKLAEARKSNPKAELFNEALVNVMGYEHMQNGDTKGAVEILKLNATAFPNSPNVYDSLSDAYLADGQKELSRENAKKALEALASDTADPEARRNAIRDSAQQKLK